jgi:ABC-2 type transport system permease protein
MSAVLGVVRYEYRMLIRNLALWGFALLVTVSNLGETSKLVTTMGQQPWKLAGRVAVDLCGFMPLVVGVLVADRLVRDRRLLVRELLQATPLTRDGYLAGKFLGVLAVSLTPMLVIWVAELAWLVGLGADARVLLAALPAFLAINVPCFMFVVAWSLACPEVLPVRVFQVLYTGYWVWANNINPQYIPTLNGSLLTPHGLYAADVFFGYTGWAFNWHPFTLLTAILSIVALVGSGLAVLWLVARYWDWQENGRLQVVRSHRSADPQAALALPPHPAPLPLAGRGKRNGEVRRIDASLSPREGEGQGEGAVQPWHHGRNPAGSALSGSAGWVYQLRIFRHEQLWGPLAIAGVFALIVLVLRGDARLSNEMARTFVGMILPLLAGMLAASLIVDDPALELQLAAPRAPWRLLLERLAVLLILVALLGTAFQGFAALLGVERTLLTNPLRAVAMWLLPSIPLMALGSTAALALCHGMGGALAVGFVWFVQLVVGALFSLPLLRHLYLFAATRSAAPIPGTNVLGLGLLAAALIVVSTQLMKKEERYL